MSGIGLQLAGILLLNLYALALVLLRAPVFRTRLVVLGPDAALL